VITVPSEAITHEVWAGVRGETRKGWAFHEQLAATTARERERERAAAGNAA
jgi:hypothetical protein